MKVSGVKQRLVRFFRVFLFIFGLALAILPGLVNAAPFAAIVIDARTGQVLYSRNADTRLHPASLTKMMTLYIAFQAIEHGEISLDDMVTISRNAASEPPSKLGMRPGQKIKLRYLIRAAAIKSANDAATAIGEAIEGSEAAFARRMNRTAKALGMTRTTFRNANGLTARGHLATARDMVTLGRHLFYDFPQYYNLFSRRSADAGIRRVASTNRRFLASYRGADGIKTGYTAASGFNLVGSAHRGRKHIIAAVFGGVSTASRNRKMAELLDLGFRRAPARAQISKPPVPDYASTHTGAGARQAGASVRIVRAVAKSPRPVLRPEQALPQPSEEVLMAMATGIQSAVLEANSATTPASTTNGGPMPIARPASLTLASATAANPPQGTRRPEVVTRISTSGGRIWRVNLGSFQSKYEAERMLLKTALVEIGTLDEALRKVVRSSRGYEANFVGLSKDMANLACRRLSARNITCTPLGPG